jgi:hypothetical protein
VQDLLSFSLLSRNIKINILNYNFASLFYVGEKTWSLTLREECRLMVFENRMLRRIFGPKRVEVKRSGENYIIRSLVICTPHQILFG